MLVRVAEFFMAAGSLVRPGAYSPRTNAGFHTRGKASGPLVSPRLQDPQIARDFCEKVNA
jgi:hypothetical protein